MVQKKAVSKKGSKQAEPPAPGTAESQGFMWYVYQHLG
jgi:hypothetical protein